MAKKTLNRGDAPPMLAERKLEVSGGIHRFNATDIKRIARAIQLPRDEIEIIDQILAIQALWFDTVQSIALLLTRQTLPPALSAVLSQFIRAFFDGIVDISGTVVDNIMDILISILRAELPIWTQLRNFFRGGEGSGDKK